MVKEAMRFYLVSPLIARETSKKVEIGGYTLPKVFIDLLVLLGSNNSCSSILQNWLTGFNAHSIFKSNFLNIDSMIELNFLDFQNLYLILLFRLDRFTGPNFLPCIL